MIISSNESLSFGKGGIERMNVPKPFRIFVWAIARLFETFGQTASIATANVRIAAYQIRFRKSIQRWDLVL